MSALDKGRQLEEEVAAHFAANGYEVLTNVILEGRSGGRHEVDVLAEKTDNLTSHSVAIECKARSQPIEKDVVSKLAYILDDLRIGKGIIVSTGGWRSGVDHAAKELGIELWGPDDLRARVDSEVRVEPTHEVLGYPVATDELKAEKILRRSGKSSLGRVREAMTWMTLVWLPVHKVELVVAREKKSRKLVVSEERISNFYDGLSARFLGPAFEMEPVDCEANGVVLPAQVAPGKLMATLRKSIERYAEVSSVAAIERHTATLQSMGIPMPCVSATVEQSVQVAVPFFVASLESKDDKRLAAVDARTGKLDVTISSLLTAQSPLVRTALRR